MQGDRHNEGKRQLTLLLDAADALEGAARVLEFGLVKYSRGNWTHGFPFITTLDSLLRHTLAFYRGEDVDPESGELHVDMITTNALFLAQHFRDHKELDNRPSSGNALLAGLTGLTGLAPAARFDLHMNLARSLGDDLAEAGQKQTGDSDHAVDAFGYRNQISKDEADRPGAALAQSAAQLNYYDGEWHAWDGGDRPVRHDTRVDVEFRGAPGQFLDRYRNGDKAGNFVGWRHRFGAIDIVRFRVVK